MHIITLVLLLLLVAPSPASALESPVCFVTHSAVALQGSPEFADLTVKLYFERRGEGVYSLHGFGSNPHGDFAPVTGVAARRQGVWYISLTGTLQTFDGRGYYLLSSVIHLQGETAVGWIGNIDVSYADANDFAKPPENPVGSPLEIIDCAGVGG